MSSNTCRFQFLCDTHAEKYNTTLNSDPQQILSSIYDLLLVFGTFDGDIVTVVRSNAEHAVRKNFVVPSEKTVQLSVK